MKYRNKIALTFFIPLLLTIISVASLLYYHYDENVKGQINHLERLIHDKSLLFAAYLNPIQTTLHLEIDFNKINKNLPKDTFIIIAKKNKSDFSILSKSEETSPQKIEKTKSFFQSLSTKEFLNNQHFIKNDMIYSWKQLKGASNLFCIGVFDLNPLNKSYIIPFAIFAAYLMLLYGFIYLLILKINELVLNQLQNEEKKFLDTFEQAAVGITHLSLDGKWIAVNNKFCNIVGYSREELIGKPFKSITHPDDLETDMIQIQAVLSKKIPYYTLDKRYIKKNGKPIWVRLTLSLTKTQDNNPKYFITVVEDITDSKLSQFELVEEKERSKKYLELAGVLMIALDQNWNIVMLNKKGSQVLEYSIEEVENQNIFETMFPQTKQEEIKNYFQSLIEKKENQMEEVELQIINKSGQKKLISWNIIFFYNENKDFRGLLASGEDITEKKQVEKTLMLARKVFENTNDAIVITDFKGTILDVNQAFVKITGFSAQEAIGENPRILKSGKHDKNFYKAMWNSLIREGRWQGEILDKRKNGEIYPKWMSINAIKDEKGKITNFISTFSDITQTKQNEEFFQYLAYYDTLTDLPNRMLFHDRLQQGLTQAERDGQMLALMFLDLDRFKYVNDTLGHQAGDQLLSLVAKRLKQCVYETDTVARLGGDEFTIILRNIGDESTHKVTLVAKRIIQAFSKPFYIENQELFMTGSIGITIFPIDGHNIDELVKNADIAMYHAKALGKNTYQFFSTEMNIKNFELMDMEVNLRRAIERNEFHLQFQPLVDLSSDKVIGGEALLRWKPSKSGMVSPEKFIPLAEETGLIIPISQWVTKEVVKKLSNWNKIGIEPIKISINISTIQFKESHFVSDWVALFEELDLNSFIIELELTESILMQDIDKGIQIIHKLKELGLNIAIDDFGTGYSSLNYLKQLPIDTLKIDQSFIRDISMNKSGSIVDAIIAMGHSMDMKVVAEGVENENHVDFLKKHFCDQAQGYYYSKPINEDQFIKILKNGRTIKK